VEEAFVTACEIKGKLKKFGMLLSLIFLPTLKRRLLLKNIRSGRRIGPLAELCFGKYVYICDNNFYNQQMHTLYFVGHFIDPYGSKHVGKPIKCPKK
jgi:hypothetical protein